MIWLLFSIIYAGKLSTLAQIVPKNQYDVLAQVDEIGSLLSIYYVCIGIILCLIAFFMIDTMPSRLGASKSLGIVAAPVFLSLIVLLINVTNLRVINADIAFKTAEPFVSTNQWKMATLLYQQALQLAPMEDHYYLFLGRSYLEQAKSAQTVQEQDALILQAEDDLKIAQRINPLNTDHTANLARLYNWWASRATDSATLLERGQIANDYFATAVTLSPNNMTIRGEWAILNIQILQQPQIAFDLLSRAIEIDPNYSFTQGLMGDFYSTLADSTDDYAGKKAALEQAVNFYLEATRVHSRRDTTPISTYLLSLGSAYIELAGQEDESSSIAYNQLAIDALEAAMNSDLPEDDLWRVQELLAKVYAALGDNQSAITYAQVALAGAPDDALERIQTLIETIQGTP
jgi:tetratricopeptide (TPR) repeat protein